jgi:hypothetical protein
MVKTLRDQPEMWQIMPAMFIKTEHRKILNKQPEVKYIHELTFGNNGITKSEFIPKIRINTKILSN